MKQLLISIRYMIFMTLLLGLAYPFLVTGLAQVLFPKQASGDFVSRSGQLVGSRLIAQNFEKKEYFWPRPSAVGFNPLSSGGSNLGQASQSLKKAYDELKTKMKSAHPEQQGEPPQDMLFASSTGLDPHVSPEAAHYQLNRVSKARNLQPEAVEKLIEQATEGRQLGILGEPTVNILVLNMLLDKSQGIEGAPVLAPTPTPSPSPSENK